MHAKRRISHSVPPIHLAPIRLLTVPDPMSGSMNPAVMQREQKKNPCGLRVANSTENPSVLEICEEDDLRLAGVVEEDLWVEGDAPCEEVYPPCNRGQNVRQVGHFNYIDQLISDMEQPLSNSFVRQKALFEKKGGQRSLMQYYVSKHPQKLQSNQIEQVDEEDHLETFESQDFSDDDSNDLAYRKAREEKVAQLADETNFGDYIKSQINNFFDPSTSGKSPLKKHPSLLHKRHKSTELVKTRSSKTGELDGELCHMYKLLNKDCVKINQAKKAKVVQRSARKGVVLSEKEVNLLDKGKMRNEGDNLTTTSDSEEEVFATAAHKAS